MKSNVLSILFASILPFVVNANMTIHHSISSAPTVKDGTLNMLDNGMLKFGDVNNNKDSITSSGTLRQPFYNNADGVWKKLTYSDYPLDIIVAAGGEGSETWNTNGTYHITNRGNADQYKLDELVKDYSGFISTAPNTGHGTVIATGALCFDNGTGICDSNDTARFNDTVKLEVAHRYTLDQGKKLLKVNTKITNLSEEPATNIRVVVGTGDDWIGNTDMPTKTRGTIVDGKFVELAQASDRSSAISVTSGNEGLLFYSTSSMVYSSIANRFNFELLFTVNPATTPITNTNDGAYGFFVRMPDLASGDSSEFDWIYAAAPIDEFDDLIADAEAAASGDKTVLEDSPVKFSAEDFKGINNEVYEKIKITELPQYGKLSLNGQSVAIGTEVTKEQYTALIYTPALNYSGDDSFTWQGWDKNDGDWASGATMSMKVTAINDAPVISGVPKTKASLDEEYIFTPTACDAEGDALTFEIQNQPSWAVFDPDTGTLFGTPVATDLGDVTEGIVITVNDGNLGQAQLEAFRIEVVTGSELVDIHNKSGASMPLWFLGLGSMLIALRRFTANKR